MKRRFGRHAGPVSAVEGPAMGAYWTLTSAVAPGPTRFHRDRPHVH